MNKQLIVAGGGFAGLWAALAAKRETAERSVDVTLLSRDPYLTLRPRLYEANPQQMRVPLADSLTPVGVDITVADIEAVDTDTGVLRTSAGSVPYDRLVLATGSRQKPLPLPGAEHCLTVDDFSGALALDEHLQKLLHGTDSAPRILIIGAGFTGIELATELRVRAEGSPAAGRLDIILIDTAAHVGPELGVGPRPEIERALAEARIGTRLNTRVRTISADGVLLASGEFLSAGIVVNCTGLEASPLAASVGGQLDDKGRLHVDELLRVQGAGQIFAAGDSARGQTDEAGHLTLQSCQHALVTGRYAGHNAACDLLGRPGVPYRQSRYLTCLDLGASGAVVTQGWDRQVILTGEDANRLKRDINTRWIYPPTGSAAEILAEARLPEEEAA